MAGESRDGGISPDLDPGLVEEGREEYPPVVAAAAESASEIHLVHVLGETSNDDDGEGWVNVVTDAVFPASRQYHPNLSLRSLNRMSP